MPHAFPTEVLGVVIDQVGEGRDFHTLFNCALTCKLLADFAVPWLYRTHTDHNVFNKERKIPEIYEEINYKSLRYLRRRTKLWQSIILSTTGKTAYPYCLYIRSLNLSLRALKRYAHDCHILSLETLFAPEMVKFLAFIPKVKDHTSLSRKSIDNVDFLKTNHLIENSILSYITEATKESGVDLNIEFLRWHTDSGVLTQYLDRMTKLKTLSFSSRSSTCLRSLAEAIPKNCPKFQDLRVMTSSHTKEEKEDVSLSHFLNQLKPNTLQIFKTTPDDFNTRRVHHCSIGTETLLALDRHGETLKSLKLCCAHREVMESIPRLVNCRNITILRLFFPSGTEPDMATPEGQITFQALIDWICSCRKLRKLYLGNSINGSAILKEVCSKDWIRLQKLEILRTNFLKNEDLFKALSTQTSLEYLRIGGYHATVQCAKEAEKYFSMAIPHLTNLRFLDINSYDMHTLGGDYSQSAIIKMISNLSQLEVLMINCNNATDDILPTLAKFHRLRILDINGISNFTFDGLLAYINGLQDTNKGMQVSIVTHDPLGQFARKERQIIREAIRERVKGYFRMEYTNV